jgi:hypothetical protein
MHDHTSFRGSKQPQLSLFVWLTNRYRRWWKMPDHARMLKRMFGRIATEECRDL